MDRRLLQTAHQPSWRNARGQTLVIFALFLVVLVTAMALGVDGARFYAEGLRVQRAADEAALAAVVHAGNGNTVAAQTAAQDMATRNLPPGVTPSVNTAISAVPVNQVRVQVTENHYPFLFAPIFGLKSGTITREATAQYNAPVPMGNPSNTLGDIGDVAGTGDITTYTPGPSGLPGSGTATLLRQHMVLSINGPDQWLESGDPYSPRYVLSDCPFVNYGAGCQGDPSPDKRIMPNPYNSDGSFSGYKYRVTIPSGNLANAITYIQVYDAETCSSNTFNDALGSSQYGVPWAGTNESRNGPNYNAATDGPVRTYFGLDYLDPTTGQAVAMSGAPVHRDPALPTGLTGVPADTVIAPSDNCSDAANGLTFKNQWYTLTKVSGSGTYIVTASTCPTAASNSDKYGTGTGAVYYKCRGSEVNNFVLRAVTEPNTNSCITGANSGADMIDCQSFTPPPNTITAPELAGLGRISIEVSSSGTTPIYLANIDPIYQGKWLLVKLYDPGDLYGGSSLQIVRPDGTYAPFEWYTQTVDVTGTTFEMGLQNFSGNASLITSFSTGSPAPYTTPLHYNTADPSTDQPGPPPVAPACGQPMAPATYLPPAAPAYGQTMAEDNPFDPLHKNAHCFTTNDYHAFQTTPVLPVPAGSGINTSDTSDAYKSYQASPSSTWNYRPYNGRWVYMFTQIPTDYATNTCENGSNLNTCGSSSNGSANPHKNWWYIQYKTEGGPFTDRTTWETAIIDTPPHLIH